MLLRMLRPPLSEAVSAGVSLTFVFILSYGARAISLQKSKYKPEGLEPTLEREISTVIIYIFLWVSI